MASVVVGIAQCGLYLFMANPRLFVSLALSALILSNYILYFYSAYLSRAVNFNKIFTSTFFMRCCTAVFLLVVRLFEWYWIFFHSTSSTAVPMIPLFMLFVSCGRFLLAGALKMWTLEFLSQFNIPFLPRK